MAEQARPSRLDDGKRTIGALWQRAESRSSGGPAYLVEGPAGWSPVSTEEASRRVDDLANGLLALGLAKGDAVAILAATRLEWVLLDFALARIGAVSAPIYANSSPADSVYILEHSDAVAAFAEDEEQLAKLEAARSSLRHAFSFADLARLEEQGREFAARHPTALTEAAEAVDEDDLYTFIYTSGTTGPPKGCMIRHRNYYAMAAVVDGLEDLVVAGDTMLLYLPLAHNFGRLMHLAGAYVGFTVAFCPDPLRVGDVLPAVRPTVLPTVPRVLEKVHDAVQTTFAEATGVRRHLIARALAVGYRVSRLRQDGRSVPARLATQHRLADRLVYAKVKDRLGGRLRGVISGGAPLAQPIAEFFHALDILVLEGYGLTECTTAATVNRPRRFRFGTVGPALPGFELRTADDGEVLIRSETIFAGYHKDEAATRDVLQPDGWLRSGDVGSIDSDGFLTITDRKKDLIVTAGGKNIAPQNLESALKSAREISQALVIGDRRPYIVALITLDEAATAGLSDDEKHARVQAAVDQANRERSRFEQIKRFAILPRDFSAEHDEVTPTLKLKRRVCEEHFAAEIEALYAAEREPAS